jgi:hypothetical protein
MNIHNILENTNLSFIVYATVSGVRVGPFSLKKGFNGWESVLIEAQQWISSLFQRLEVIHWRCMNFDGETLKRVNCSAWPPESSQLMFLVVDLKSSVLFYFSF